MNDGREIYFIILLVITEYSESKSGTLRTRYNVYRDLSNTKHRLRLSPVLRYLSCRNLTETFILTRKNICLCRDRLYMKRNI